LFGRFGERLPPLDQPREYAAVGRGLNGERGPNLLQLLPPGHGLAAVGIHGGDVPDVHTGGADPGRIGVRGQQGGRDSRTRDDDSGPFHLVALRS
jgi:hypothetical protein